MPQNPAAPQSPGRSKIRGPVSHTWFLEESSAFGLDRSTWKRLGPRRVRINGESRIWLWPMPGTSASRSHRRVRFELDAEL